MSFVTRNFISAFGLHNTQRASSASSTQRGQGVLAQQPAAPRQSGGGTPIATAGEHTFAPGEGLHQDRGTRATAGDRFRAFIHKPLFRNKNASSRPSAPADETHNIAMRTLSTPAPQLQLNLPDRDTEGLGQALDRVWSEASTASPNSEDGASLRRFDSSRREDSPPDSARSSTRDGSRASGETSSASLRSEDGGSLRRFDSSRREHSPPGSARSSARDGSRASGETSTASLRSEDGASLRRFDSSRREHSPPGSARSSARDGSRASGETSTASLRSEDGASLRRFASSQREASPVNSERNGSRSVASSQRASSEVSTAAPNSEDGIELRRFGSPRPPVTQAAMPRNEAAVKLRLDEGKATLLRGPAIRVELLKQTIGRDKQHYQDIASSSDNQQHILLEDSGRLLAVHSSTDALTGVASSKIEGKWQRTPTPGLASSRSTQRGATDHTLKLSNDNNQVEVSQKGVHTRVPAKMKLPDAAILSQLTGVYAQQDGKQSWRIHDKKAYQMAPGGEAWKVATPPGLEADKDIAQLSRQGDNQLYCVHDSTRLCNLETHIHSEKMDDKIGKAAVAPDGKALLLLKNETTHKQSLTLLPRLDAPANMHQTLTVKPADIELAAIVQDQSHVFAADYQGKLRVASHADESGELKFSEGEALTLQNRLNNQIKNVVGDTFHVEDVVHGDDRQLHVIVKDRQDRKHAIALNHPHDIRHVPSTWNLSDSMVMDFQKGLPQLKPEPQDTVSVGQGGLVTLHDDKIHFFNDTTQNWEATEVKAKAVRCGQDGQAWIRTESNELKRLKMNFTSNKINAEQNAFALSQVKKSFSEDLAMAGLDKNLELVAIGALDNGRFAALEENGNLHIRHVNADNRRDRQAPVDINHQSLQQAMIGAETRGSKKQGPVEAHKAKDMAIGTDNSLFLLSDKGKIFSVAQADWLKGDLSKMKMEALPAKIGNNANLEDTIADKFIVNQRNRLLAKTTDGKLIACERDNDKKTTKWKEINEKDIFPAGDGKNYARKYYDRISSATPEGRVGTSGLTYKQEVNTFGQTGHDGYKVHTPFRTRLNTFVFRPVVHGRPVKNMVDLMQHSYGGRQGLNAIYQEQGKQLNALEHHLAHPPRRIDDQPLDEQISALSIAGAPAWLAEVQSFSTVLAESAARHATQLKDHYGQDKNEVSKGFTAMTNHLNPASTRNGELTDKLTRLFGEYPASNKKHAHAALNTLHTKNVKLSHQKAGNVPLGLHRDKYDETGLIKSRLILDGVTSAKLHDLTFRVGEAMKKQGEAKTKELASLEKEFTALRDNGWMDNPITRITRQGFGDNDRLEANYDAMKTMMRAFSEENHAVSVTARTVTRSANNTELAENLRKTILSMEKDESISFSRAYGVTSTVTGVPSIPGNEVFVGVGGRGSLDRGYNLSLTRSEGGINVSFGRDGGGSVTVIGGAGYNILTDHMKSHPVHIDSKRELSPGVRFGGGISVTPLDLKKQNGVSFEITEAEFPAFIQGLAEGKLDPLSLLDRGINHSVRHGNVMSVSLDANLAGMASVGLPFTSKAEKETPASFRAGLGGYMSANLAYASRERESSRKEDGNAKGRSNNHLQAFNRGAIGGNFALPTGVIIQNDKGRMPVFSGPAASIQRSVDSTTRHNLSMGTKVPRPLAGTDMDKLTESMGKSFTDPKTAKLMEDLKDPKKDEDKTAMTPKQKLDRLDAHFTPRNYDSRNNAQRGALRDLDKHIRQQKAWEEGNLLLDSGEHKVTFSNMNKVTGDSLKDNLAKLLGGLLASEAVEKVIQLAENDERLKETLSSLKDNTSATAVVTLEMKDDARDDLEDRLLNGGKVPDDLSQELVDYSKMRVKSIDFTKTQTKSDGFATPAFLLGGSNSASVAMKRSLGKISFSYGKDQDLPTGYTLDGRIAKINDRLADTLRQAQQADFVLR
ncbi:AvrE-family type 3 secretion system effector [Erwinia oleae]|uniref:AvrE-family type 3 secretion system effector n=1 Tax=Erwinia oleae TaxID=796334 RepID=UPI0005548D0D|nr:AvrE-family type 3 secretion system effector [Erwinia oleae]